MVGRLIQKSGRRMVGLDRRFLDQAGELGDPMLRQLLVIEPGHQFGGAAEIEVVADSRVERSLGTSPIHRTNTGPQSRVSQPKGGAFVSQ